MIKHYESIPFPYPGSYRELSRREAKVGFDQLMLERDERIRSFMQFMAQNGLGGVQPNVSLPDLDDLPKQIVAVGGKRRITRSERESSISAIPHAFRSFARGIFPKWEASDESLALCFDGGLLWGEAFIHKYPEAMWSIGGGPKSSVDFQHPVIKGVDEYQLELNPIRELVTLVEGVIERDKDPWTISRLSRVRAEHMGLIR